MILFFINFVKFLYDSYREFLVDSQIIVLSIIVIEKWLHKTICKENLHVSAQNGIQIRVFVCASVTDKKFISHFWDANPVTTCLISPRIPYRSPGDHTQPDLSWNPVTDADMGRDRCEPWGRESLRAKFFINQASHSSQLSNKQQARSYEPSLNFFLEQSAPIQYKTD